MSSNLSSRGVYQKNVRELTRSPEGLGRQAWTRGSQKWCPKPTAEPVWERERGYSLGPERLLAPLTCSGLQKLLPKPLLSLELVFALPTTRMVSAWPAFSALLASDAQCRVGGLIHTA